LARFVSFGVARAFSGDMFSSLMAFLLRELAGFGVCGGLEGCTDSFKDAAVAIRAEPRVALAMVSGVARFSRCKERLGKVLTKREVRNSLAAMVVDVRNSGVL